MISHTVLEIWHMADVIVVFHFGQFFAPPHHSPKNKNFKKMKKGPKDIVILHNCTNNYDYRLYCSWDMSCDRCNWYFSFWAILCPCTPPPFTTAQKRKISKKWKKCLKISSLYTIVPVTMIIGYTVPEIWDMTDVIVIFHFGLFFALLPL